MSINYLTPFSDWLSISYPISCSPHSELISFLNQYVLFGYTDLGKGKESYKGLDGGVCFITSKNGYCNISISGSVIQKCRDAGAFRDFISILSLAPHNITRLDAAYDVPVSGHKVIKRIQATYPDCAVELANRRRRLQYVLDQDSDGNFTGTAYFQNSTYKGTVKLRVYDKTHQMFQVFGETIPTTTRYELSVARGASLRDFSDPTSVFWHFLPHGLLEKPSGIADWSAAERINYDDYADSLVTDYEKLRFLIQSSPALLDLVKKANTVNGGSTLLEREIRSMVSMYAAGMERSGDPAMSHVTPGLSTVLDA